MGFVTQAAILAGRGMHDSGLPMNGDLRMTCQAQVRLLLCQMFSLAGPMRQMTTSALLQFKRLVYIFFL